MKIISVDGGTTNTRLTLIDSGNIADMLKCRIGAGDSIANESESPYIVPLKNGISQILKQNTLKESDIEAVVFSGMICSEIGLYNVPHIEIPADINDVSRNLKRSDFTDICNIPMYFVPGLKISGSAIDDSDIMRGEETELFGIYRSIKTDNFIVILPGSHNKTVRIGVNGTIEDFRTAMTGELIRSTAENTILKTKLANVFPENLNEKYLSYGYDICEKKGINQALFKVRILEKTLSPLPDDLYSFHCGICMCEDIKAIARCSRGLPVFVAGSNPFRSAYIYLLKNKCGINAAEIPSEISEHAAAYGAEAIMKTYLKQMTS